MSKIIKQILAMVLFALLVINPVFCDNDSDAVYNNISKEYKLNNDGSFEYHYSCELKLLTSYAFNRAYGETFIVYNPDYQDLKINKSYTLMADGREVASPPNAFNEVLPRCAAHSAPDLNLREMVVTHTGIEKNAVIFLDYTIKTKPGFLPGMSDFFIIPENSPVRKYTINLSVPQGMVINQGILNYKYKPMQKNSEGLDTYSYELTNIPIYKHEAGSPAEIDFLPAFWFSTTTDNDIRKHVFGNDNLFIVNEMVKNKVSELTEVKTEILDKALALKNYIESNIGLSHCPFKYSAYKPMTAQEVFDRNTGSTLDKSVLLAAMCRESGINATPLIASATSDKHISGCIDSYTRAAVAIELIPDRIAIIASDSHDQEFFMNSDDFIPLFADVDFEKKSVDALPPGKLSFGLKLRMDDDNKFSGILNSYLKGEYLHDYLKSTAVKHIKSVIGVGYKTDFNDNGLIYPGNPVYSCILNIEASRQPEFFKDGLSMELPFSKGSIEKHFGELINTERTNPLNIMHRIDETIEYVIDLPENIDVFIPEKTVINNDLGKIEIKFRKDGNKLSVSKYIYLNKQEIPAEKYTEFYMLISNWLADRYNTLNLIRKLN